MKRYSIIAFAILAWLLGSTAVLAQSLDRGNVIATCGTLAVTYPLNTPQALTIDVNGRLCTAAAGGTQNVNLTQVGGAAIALGQAAMAASLPVAIASNQSAVPVSQSGTWTVQPGNTPNTAAWLIVPSSQYPSGASAITASTTGTTGATTATLAGVSNKTTYICGFTITSDATAALAGAATVTGTITGTLNYIQNVGSATAAGLLSQTFNPCVPASAANTGIAINSVAAGTGGNTAVTGWGYQL